MTWTESGSNAEGTFSQGKKVIATVRVQASVPLVWAHSEYVKLHRSVVDGRVFDLVEPVHDRYVRHKGRRKTIEVWKFDRQVQMVAAGSILRIQANSPFLLHWTTDDWRRATDTPSRTTRYGN